MAIVRGLKDALAGLLGAVAFAVFFLFLDAGLLVSALCGIGGLIAGLLLFPAAKTIDLGSGVGTDELRDALAGGERSLAALRKAAKVISDPKAAAKVAEIAKLVERILDDIRKDPKDLKNARQFLSYYLDATIKIVDRYVEISAQGLSDASVQTSLRKVEGMLETIRAAFEKQLARLLSDDVLDLDTELGLLEKTIRMEGLGDDGTEHAAAAKADKRSDI